MRTLIVLCISLFICSCNYLPPNQDQSSVQQGTVQKSTVQESPGEANYKGFLKFYNDFNGYGIKISAYSNTKFKIEYVKLNGNKLEIKCIGVNWIDELNYSHYTAPEFYGEIQANGLFISGDLTLQFSPDGLAKELSHSGLGVSIIYR